ncbi:hypothetical protein [Legionella jordanis]|uniref:Uncharacterized protein n=1 Tax=Legionella jordanis TaxID=456 RepID=A0A0W0VH41_9GAMM|nr:hypothetical protein [Legionella jordanis]KTD19094.1 hypothetical protein Ljor_0060 [Legionella jordanis]VEH12940.1 Uncharacterised protein [Legionella jordanis]
MYSFKDAQINAYVTQARTIALIKGNSSILYPFYTSSGENSKSKDTWFPYMGYLDYPDGDSSKGEVFMVKPVNRTVSTESAAIIKKYLAEEEAKAFINSPDPDEDTVKTIEKLAPGAAKILYSGLDPDEELTAIIKQHFEGVAESFINRMGNDEALAISCSLGGGVWEKYPEMRDEIMSATPTAKFIKPIEKITYTESPIRNMSAEEKKQLVDFEGTVCKGKVKKSHAEMASHMESLIQKESQRFVSKYFIPAKKDFPSTQEANQLLQLTHAQEVRDRYANSVTHLVQMHRNKEKAEEKKASAPVINQPDEGGLNP